MKRTCVSGCTCGKHVSRPKSPEHRLRISESLKGVKKTEEHNRNVSLSKMGTYKGTPAQGRYFSNGYIMLSGRQDHPLAKSDGVVAEHRVVLYDKIGPGPHNCVWCSKELDWTALDDRALCTDHQNNDMTDNRPENLEPSCRPCNWQRGRWPEWQSALISSP